MKGIWAMFVCVLMVPEWGHAQAVPSEVSQGLETTEEEVTSASVAFQAEMFYRIFGMEMQVDGLVPKVIHARNPLQLFNPFAPMEYGDGYDNVTLDPLTGEATGIRLFSIEF